MKKKQIPTVLTFPSGLNQSAFWRVHWPSYQMMVMEKAKYNKSVRFLRDSIAYRTSDVVQIQRISTEKDVDFLEKLCSLKKELEFRLVYDVDDILFIEDIPGFHSGKENTKFFNNQATKRAMELCDEIILSTPFLKEYYIQKGIETKCSVISNKIPYFWAGNYYHEDQMIKNYRNHKHRPRILYAGATSHIHFRGEPGKDDFSHVIEAIKSSIHQFKWVFLGAIPWELLPNKEAEEVEFYEFEVIERYPKRVASLECSMMIAPLADHIFNYAKADVKFQEACSHGMPIACQDIIPYKHCPIRFDTGEKMLEVIRDTLKNEESYLKACRVGRHMVDKLWLELPENTAQYEELFTYPYADKRRVHINKVNHVKGR
ncbi:MAG: hypothetical protein SP4CHLAM5_07330 [Chlamydiia bacterium]|nr:hypothetical protein [Chlamydiia bacterium]MCH9618600.1 hypothetical protein [Chlamydiia bacterium]MCH9624320.1 hypothetical protein [Chlamydiia bacterium]